MISLKFRFLCLDSSWVFTFQFDFLIICYFSLIYEALLHLNNGSNFFALIPHIKFIVLSYKTETSSFCEIFPKNFPEVEVTYSCLWLRDIIPLPVLRYHSYKVRLGVLKCCYTPISSTFNYTSVYTFTIFYTFTHLVIALQDISSMFFLYPFSPLCYAGFYTLPEKVSIFITNFKNYPYYILSVQ